MYWLIAFLLVIGLYGDEPPSPDPEEARPEEARFVRRIMAFWQDGDTAIVEAEIAQFLTQYPQSSFCDSLYILRGDLKWRAQDYREALKNYEAVREALLAEKVLNHRLDCYLRLKQYDTLIRTVSSRLPTAPHLSSEELVRLYYYAEALFHTQALSQAASWYKRLLETSQEENALLALSEIKAAIGGYGEAAQGLLALSYRLPAQRDVLLDRAIYLRAQQRDYGLATIYNACENDSAEEVEVLIEGFAKEFPHDSALADLSLRLFNLYVQQGEEGGRVDRAAEHLFRAGTAAKRENRLWLAQHYYDKAKPLEGEEEIVCLQEKSAIEHAKKARLILQSLVEARPEPSLERQWIQLSLLEGWLGADREQIERLQALVQAQQETPEQGWKLRSCALFVLARLYEQQNAPRLALEYYQQLMETKSPDLHFGNRAKLAWARLAYAALSPEQHKLEDPTMMAILKALKELQMRRQLQQEPLHLEAAIDYTALRSALEPPEKQEEQQRLLLLRVKEEFTSQEGLWAQDYQASRVTYPEKERVYQAYLILIDAHRLRLEAKIAARKGQALDAQIKTEAASALYKKITHGDFAVSKYLIDQAILGINSL